MVGWHHRLNGHGFEQVLEDGEGQGSHVTTCNPCGPKEPDTTEQQQVRGNLLERYLISLCQLMGI